MGKLSLWTRDVAGGWIFQQSIQQAMRVRHAGAATTALGEGVNQFFQQQIGSEVIVAESGCVFQFGQSLGVDAGILTKQQGAMNAYFQGFWEVNQGLVKVMQGQVKSSMCFKLHGQGPLGADGGGIDLCPIRDQPALIAPEDGLLMGQEGK